jgi:glucan phosphoethanolaminetransferase (alkaline phosphatase superfamily)
MKKISIGKVAIAALVASLAFLFVETILEGGVLLVFGVSEAKMMQEASIPHPSGTIYFVLAIVYLYLVCALIMWVYAAIRPRFKNHMGAALAASLVFWLFAFLFVVNYSNIGLYPLKFALLGMGFNLIEIPFAVMAGALVYRE